jgi:CDGSH-type Zn-finger protein
MPPVRLTPLPDGPYELAGHVEIVDRDGRQIERPASTIYLCRCGRSARKPFCDGSHARTAWKDDA